MMMGMQHQGHPWGAAGGVPGYAGGGPHFLPGPRPFSQQDEGERFMAKILPGQVAKLSVQKQSPGTGFPPAPPPFTAGLLQLPPGLLNEGAAPLPAGPRGPPPRPPPGLEIEQRPRANTAPLAPVGSERQQLEQARSLGLPSVGSLGHALGTCTPCSFYCYSTMGCREGESCQYCHVIEGHPSKRKGKRGEWVKNKRQIAKERQLEGLGGALSPVGASEKNKTLANTTTITPVKSATTKPRRVSFPDDQKMVRMISPTSEPDKNTPAPAAAPAPPGAQDDGKFELILVHTPPSGNGNATGKKKALKLEGKQKREILKTLPKAQQLLVAEAERSSSEDSDSSDPTSATSGEGRTSIGTDGSSDEASTINNWNPKVGGRIRLTNQDDSETPDEESCSEKETSSSEKGGSPEKHQPGMQEGSSQEQQGGKGAPFGGKAAPDPLLSLTRGLTPAQQAELHAYLARSNGGADSAGTPMRTIPQGLDRYLQEAIRKGIQKYMEDNNSYYHSPSSDARTRVEKHALERFNLMVAQGARRNGPPPVPWKKAPVSKRTSEQDLL